MFALPEWSNSAYRNALRRKKLWLKGFEDLWTVEVNVS